MRNSRFEQGGVLHSFITLISGPFDRSAHDCLLFPIRYIDLYKATYMEYIMPYSIYELLYMCMTRNLACMEPQPWRRARPSLRQGLHAAPALKLYGRWGLTGPYIGGFLGT